MPHASSDWLMCHKISEEPITVHCPQWKATRAMSKRLNSPFCWSFYSHPIISVLSDAIITCPTSKVSTSVSKLKLCGKKST